MIRAGRILQTWTFWYFLLPAILLPCALYFGPPETRTGEIVVTAIGLLSVQAIPPLALLGRLFQTLAPLWLYELVLILWASLAGLVADILIQRFRK